MFELAKIFQNNMILQRDKPIKLFGKTDNAQTLAVSLNNTVLAQAKITPGKFSLELPAQPATENATLTIKGSGGSEVCFTNVDIGEVWVAGGQSNMQLKLRYTNNAEAVVASACDPHFRLYTVAQWAFEGEEDEGYKDASNWDSWKSWAPKNAEHFSATAAYFALRLRKSLGVPVGIIGCYWGGTPAAAWLDEEYLQNDVKLKIYLDEYEAGLANMDVEDNLAFARQMRMAMNTPEALENNDLMMLRKIALPSFAPSRKPQSPEQEKQAQAMMRYLTQTGPTSPNRPGGLYHSMVCNIAGYTCRGFIWYQGEADYRKAELYQQLFTAVIACWRRGWGEELPFLFVQLPPFGSWRGAIGDRFPEMRHAQEQVSKTVPKTWMACIMDVGEEFDAHPMNKEPVGERLALLALCKVYGKEILCEAPEFVQATLSGGKLTLEFQNTGEGLSVLNPPVTALAILQDGKELSSYSVAVNGMQMCVASMELKATSQVEVRFAWAGFCQVNLFNSVKLPAKPFIWHNKKTDMQMNHWADNK